MVWFDLAKGDLFAGASAQEGSQKEEAAEYFHDHGSVTLVGHWGEELRSLAVHPEFATPESLDGNPQVQVACNVPVRD